MPTGAVKLSTLLQGRRPGRPRQARPTDQRWRGLGERLVGPGDEGSALLAAELRVKLARAEAAVFEAEAVASRARAEAVALRVELAEARVT